MTSTLIHPDRLKAAREALDELGATVADLHADTITRTPMLGEYLPS